MKRCVALLCCLVMIFSAFDTALGENYTTLKKGDEGDKVRQMQEALLSLGYSVVVDGDFGNKTLNALKKFQKANKLEVNGKAGNATLSLLYSMASTAEAVIPNAVATGTGQVGTALKRNSDKGQVALLQTALNKANDAGLEVDGDYGDTTIAAVRDFQRKYGLEATGTANTYTLTLCYIAAGIPCDALMQCAINRSGKKVVLREAARTGARKVLEIPAGASVTVVSNSGTWYRVLYKNKSGYVQASSMQTNTYIAPTLFRGARVKRGSRKAS